MQSVSKLGYCSHSLAGRLLIADSSWRPPEVRILKEDIFEIETASDFSMKK
jgi:hypothetical protein